MKIAALKEDLQQELNKAFKFVSIKTTLPVLSHILLKSQSNNLYLSATNLEASIFTKVQAKVSEDFQIALYGKTLVDLISTLPKGTLTMSLDKEMVLIETTNFSSNMAGIAPNEFPLIPDKIEKPTFSILTELFMQSLNKVLFSTSTDESRPVLTGVLITNNKDGLYLVSSDGFRLSLIKIEQNEKILQSFSIIIPKNTLSTFSSVFSSTEISFEIRESDNQVVFGDKNTIVASRTVAGEFPNFERIIPKSTSLKVSVSKEELLDSLKRASVFARDSANVVKILISEKSIEVSTESVKFGSLKNNIDAKVEGKGFLISFNYKFIEDFLNICESDEVLIELNDSYSPVIFKDIKNPMYTHIIMPIKLD